MDRFFFKIFIRNLSRKGLFPIINIVGLSIGLAAVLLICAFIFNEYSFDKSFTHHQRIYRANAFISMLGTEEMANVSVTALAPAAKEEIPGVEAAVRVFKQPVRVTAGDVPFKVEKFCWADEDLFLLFNTPFIYGSPEEIFAEPDKVALSESQSKIFFGDKNPLGEILMLDNQHPMEVRAVYKDFPANTSLHGNQMIGHFMSAHQNWIKDLSWFSVQCETYCLLAPGTDAAVVEAAMQRLVEKNVGENPFYQISLQPFEKIHLYSKEIPLTEHITGNYGDIGQIKMFSLLAVIILLAACINYMNLSTARAQKRSKEIGVSKTVGAKRREIIRRLYAETGMFTFVSFAVAVVLVLMILPVFNMILGQNIHPEIFLNVKFLLGMLLVYLVTTFVAASYPVLYLSRFPAITVISRAAFTKGGSHALVRKGLSVVQFSAAMILIAWVMVIQMQINFVNNKDKGYNAHHLVSIPLPNQSVLDALKNDYEALESISAAAFTSGFPMGYHSGRGLYKTMADMREKQSNRDHYQTSVLYMTKASPEAIDLFQMKLIAGTTLPESRAGDSITSIVINRKAVEYLETTPEEVIGTKLPVGGFNQPNQPVYVCGVVEDFHYQNLYETVKPYGLHNWSGQGFMHLLLRVKEGNLSQQLQTYEEIFKKHFPNDLFEAKFPDLIMAKAYEADRRTGVVVLCFSILAILVACLGVFGLTAFMAEQRTKEIGIRKVFGASVFSIVRLFTDNYLRLLALSLLIAIPVAWWIGGKYLEDFAYRISLAWWMFVGAALITVVLTLATVCWQAIKAATENPVKCFKTE